MRAKSIPLIKRPTFLHTPDYSALLRIFRMRLVANGSRQMGRSPPGFRVCPLQKEQSGRHRSRQQGAQQQAAGTN
jgi:hypothetical protein